MSDFTLTAQDRSSHLWRKLRKHMEALRDEDRERNDSKQHDERETAFIRGRIDVLKDLLALDDRPASGVDAPAP